MILAIIFAHVWGVLELVALSTLTRTIRIRTVLAALAAGLYTCSLVALLLQVTWTRAAAALTGRSLYAIVTLGSYTLDPLIEELVKIMPLAFLIWLVPTVRQQWSTTDCVLMGAAAGSGFGLAEDLFRLSGSVHRFVPVNGGWELPSLLSFTVFSPTNTLRSWLPSAGVGEGSQIGAAAQYNLHLEWSALAGLAVALLFLHSTKLSRRAGIALLFYVAADHAATNWTLSGRSDILSVLFGPLNMLRSALWLMPAAALGIAWWIDRQRQWHAKAAELALAAERQSRPRFWGALRSALAQPPWSIHAVESLSRLRRAYAGAASSRANGAGSLRHDILSFRNRIDRVVGGSEFIPPMRLAHVRALRKSVRQPKVIIWLVLLLPSATWFIVGGFPKTAWLQSALMTGPAWFVVRLISLLGLIWIGSQVVLGVRRWRQIVTTPLGDETACMTLRLLCGSGAFLFGAYVFILAIIGRTPASHVLTNFHVLEAIANAVLIGSLLMAVAAVAMFPAIAAAVEIASSIAGEAVDAALAEEGLSETELLSRGLGGESADEISGSILTPENRKNLNPLFKPLNDFIQKATQQIRGSGGGYPTELPYGFDEHVSQVIAATRENGPAALEQFIESLKKYERIAEDALEKYAAEPDRDWRAGPIMQRLRLEVIAKVLKSIRGG